MASWKWPAVANKILSDVPGVNALLNALLKQDPAGTTDVPAGAKRWVDTPEGKQFQAFNGSEWQSVGKLAHDAASVDGHSAATDTTPNTIPVRDANGRIPGDISGTAEKAKEANGLSETLAIGKGGTGGTTAEQARRNLGVAPTSHASSGTDYGIGTESLYGHTKPHDAPDATLTAASGHAFSPAGAAAMQEALEDGIEEAMRNAESAHFTATIDGLDLVLSFEDGTEKRVKLPAGKSVGDLWIGFDPASKPANVQIYGGQLLSRSAYEAHSAMVLGGERTVLTEAEWQAQVDANGFCPFFSSGDGSTTYRMPLIKGVHPEFVAALAEAGSFVAAGLPEIEGNTYTIPYYMNLEASGAMYIADTATGGYGTEASTACASVGFRASRSNPIYGNSDTVQPPSVTCVLGEFVFGAVATLGEAEVEELVERIDKLETRAPGVPLGTLFPYTGEDVPAGTLRADGTVYNMQAAFPDFYEWVKNSGLTVPLGSYALVEGSCGYYGLDESTGTVRMPTLAAGVFGADAASKYGQAVEAGLPNITGSIANVGLNYEEAATTGALYVTKSSNNYGGSSSGKPKTNILIGAHLSSPIYGNSDTVTPAHVKYPWVIVVYNAAVPPSVAQAGEFIDLLDKLATALPTGTVIPHAGNKELNGYLLCNGATVSRTTYAKLFEAIGTTYGTGDGSTTFALPNLTDRFIQGSGTAGTVKDAGLPNITGRISYSGKYDGFIEEGAFALESGSKRSPGADNSCGRITTFNASRSSSIYGNSTTVQPPALTMRYYIKY